MRTFTTSSPSERVIFGILIASVIGSGLWSLHTLSGEFAVITPSPGGSLQEGIVGTPRLANPLLASSEADRAVLQLVYAGLFRASGREGYVPELAEEYEVSEDGLIYTVHLKSGLVFHDGAPITTDDVLFTVTKAQDPLIRSPRRADWEGVQVDIVDERTIIFTLRAPYAPFMENLTMGILPKHIWSNVSAEEFPLSTYNTEPIGAGPFRIDRIDRNQGGIPSSYRLVPFGRYALGEAYLRSIELSFFSTDEALMRAWDAGSLDSIAVVGAPVAARNKVLTEVQVGRLFAVFFNQNQSEIRDLAARQALSRAIDRVELVNTVLGGAGVPTDRIDMERVDARGTIEEARAILEDGGWVQGEGGLWSKGGATLEMTLATAEAPELVASVTYIKSRWEALGVPTTLEIYNLADLQQTIIRPRAFEALFFGIVLDRERDLYAFLHSSQRQDPGLNIAQYTRSDVDDALVRARRSQDPLVREEALDALVSSVLEDLPLVPLFTPLMSYVVPKNVQGIQTPTLIASPSDRFADVAYWHTKTEYVWRIFANNNKY